MDNENQHKTVRKNLYRVTLRREEVVFVVASNRCEAEAIAETHEDSLDFDEKYSFATETDRVPPYEYEALIIDPELNDAYVTVGEWLELHPEGL